MPCKKHIQYTLVLYSYSCVDYSKIKVVKVIIVIKYSVNNCRCILFTGRLYNNFDYYCMYVC